MRGAGAAESTCGGSRIAKKAQAANAMAVTQRPAEYDPVVLITAPTMPPPISAEPSPKIEMRALASTRVMPGGTSRGAAAARTTP